MWRQIVTCLTNVWLAAWWEEQVSDCSPDWSTHGGWLNATYVTSTAHLAAHLIVLSSLWVWYGFCKWDTRPLPHGFSKNVWVTADLLNVKCMNNNSSNILCRLISELAFIYNPLCIYDPICHHRLIFFKAITYMSYYHIVLFYFPSDDISML